MSTTVQASAGVSMTSESSSNGRPTVTCATGARPASTIKVIAQTTKTSMGLPGFVSPSSKEGKEAAP